MSISTNAAPRIKVLSLIAATYFIVSGGPYGLKELISNSGFDRSLLILLLIPIVWSLPTALMVGELGSALPQEGGYYAWVRRALGPFWGFQEAWLSLAASIFDMAIYPTLFTLYLGMLFPGLGHGWPAACVGATMIAACALWNLRGAGAVGRSSSFLGVLLLAPFAVLALGALTSAHPPAVASIATAGSPHGSLLVGVLVAMWNFMGWDNTSTFANEVDRPQRNYPVAMLSALALITGSYLIPVLAARHAGLDPSGWTTGSWVSAGQAIAGPWLGVALVIGGMVAPLGTFNALVLSYSRLPVAMAEDGMLPKAFAARLPRTQAPWVAIVVCAVAYVGCLGLGFERLVQLDILVYGASLALEFVALVALRIREPALHRPFRVPGGVWAAAALGCAPVALLAVAAVVGLGEEGAVRGTLFALAIIVAGPAVFWLLGLRRPISAEASA